MNTIQKQAKILHIISIVIAFFMIAWVILRWIIGLDLISNNVYLQACYTLDPEFKWNMLPQFSYMQRFLGIVVDGVAVAIVVAGVKTFSAIMQRFIKNEFFSSDIIRLCNKLSKIALCWAIYYPIKYTLLSVIMCLHAGVGHRVISAQISSTDIINIFIFICFVLITGLMQEGCKLKQEQDLTV